MRKMILSLALLALTGTLSAAELFNTYYPKGFAENIHDKTLKNEALKNALFEITSYGHQTTTTGNDVLVQSCSDRNCTIHTALGYKKARVFLFGLLDLKKDDRGYFLKDVYCENDFVRTDIGPMKIPDNTVINCEHTWPQSKFTAAFPEETQKSDLHHLFVTSSQANSARGNNPFGEIDGQAPAANCDASAIGKGTDPETQKSILIFEPPVEHRGNVARAIFYFSVRYRMAIDSMQEATLRRWHQEDPPTAIDISRNTQIQELQGNRNPFVDFPEMVDLISNF